LFGLHKNTVENPWLNYLGFSLAVVSVVIYAFIKPSIKTPEEEGPNNSKNDVEKTEYVSINATPGHLVDREGASWVDFLSPLQRRIVGLSLSVVSGLCYGSNFDPPQWLMDHNKGSSSALDYVFSHFSGILLAATCYFLIYCILKRNKPTVYPQVIVPGFISGVLWAIAQIAFFCGQPRVVVRGIIPYYIYRAWCCWQFMGSYTI